MQIIIYHQVKPGIDCPDGIAAAWVAKRRFPEALVLGASYQTELSQPLKNALAMASKEEAHFKAEYEEFKERVFAKIEYESQRPHIIAVDFSFPTEFVQNLLAQGLKITVIDHHPTALNDLSGLTDRIAFEYDVRECGATLTWKTFFPNEPIPEILEFIRDRDLWQFSLPETPVVHEAMAFLGRRMDLFDELAPLSREELVARLAPIGEPLVRQKQEKIEAIASRYEWEQVLGYKVPLVRLTLEEERFTSDVCSYLYKRISSVSFVACLMADGVTYSLRSNKDGNNTDVSAIAKQFGGGGHRNAAGVKLTTSQINAEIEEVLTPLANLAKSADALASFLTPKDSIEQE